MSDEINQVLDLFISQEERLLTQFSQIRGQISDVQKEIGRDLITLGARELFGRTGGKIARKVMEQSEKERIKSQEAAIDAQHRGIVNRISGLLGTLSEWRKNLKEPNSDMLVSRLKRAQTGVRVTTRIRATIKLLSNLKLKRLTYNKDIHTIKEIGIVLAPGSPFSGHLELTKILSSVIEYVKICDPWVDIKTLEVLLSIPSSISIKLLTGDSGKSKKFQSASKAFQVERQLYEMRVGTGLHDRFIITKNRGWLLGSSIKDFGKKFTAMTLLPDNDAKETEKIYDDLWKNALVLIT